GRLRAQRSTVALPRNRRAGTARLRGLSTGIPLTALPSGNHWAADRNATPATPTEAGNTRRPTRAAAVKSPTAALQPVTRTRRTASPAATARPAPARGVPGATTGRPVAGTAHSRPRTTRAGALPTARSPTGRSGPVR